MPKFHNVAAAFVNTMADIVDDDEDDEDDEEGGEEDEEDEEIGMLDSKFLSDVTTRSTKMTLLRMPRRRDPSNSM